jgi:hypothetical protein
MAGSTGSYERDVDTLERELGILEDTFRGSPTRTGATGPTFSPSIPSCRGGRCWSWPRIPTSRLG